MEAVVSTQSTGVFFDLQQPLTNLPFSLKRLCFGYYFKQQIGDLKQLPNLTHIYFGMNFNQPIDNLLPDSLEHLEFVHFSCFNQTINSLPPNITFLKLPSSFNQPLTALPPKITKLTFLQNFNQLINRNNLPLNLKQLEFCYDSCFNHSINDLPLSITHLTMNDMFNLPIASLPPNLKRLELGRYFNQVLDSRNLPATLEDLKIWRDFFNYPITDLPEKLTRLSIGNGFNQPLDALPSGLIYLCVGDSFDQPITSLPSTLKTFKVGIHFKQTVNLPISCELTQYRF
eukprot:TRINITY_DN6297_c0_g3_i1.p1 TRINITY_DN6297_c0_g3~~TRINITY_DN6297_c0_g3_i1.p1  ORF type:complete len:286 (-),score=61.90 TRINITY_DN6297_c0_g3_i1:75-932(-)